MRRVFSLTDKIPAGVFGPPDAHGICRALFAEARLVPLPDGRRVVVDEDQVRRHGSLAAAVEEAGRGAHDPATRDEPNSASAPAATTDGRS